MKLAPHLWSNISSNAHRLIRGLMESDPGARLTIAEYAVDCTTIITIIVDLRIFFSSSETCQGSTIAMAGFVWSTTGGVTSHGKCFKDSEQGLAGPGRADCCS